MQGYKINHFLIGVQKGGTSSFYNWLSQHPQINAPDEMKDIHFFNQQKYFAKGTRWLEDFYKEKGDNKVLLKGAVNYIYNKEVPQKIKEYNADSKFILILRDPVKRAYSAHQYFTKLGTEKRDFLQSVKDELEGKFVSENSKNHFAYLDHGYYYNQLIYWHQYFSSEKFLILIFEELFKNPQQYLPEVFNFLGVDAQLQVNFAAKNTTGEVKHRLLSNMLFSQKVRSFFKNVLKLDALIPFDKRVNFINWFRDWNTKKVHNKNELDMETYAYLQQYFKDDTNKLSVLLNKDFSLLWKY